MAIDFPTTLDTLTNPTASDKTDSPSHAGQHSDLNDAVEAIQAKVGIDSSADTDSIDYKLTNASSSNPGHKHTLAHGATDVTASAAEVNILDGVTATTAQLNEVATLNVNGNVVGSPIITRMYLNGSQENLVNTEWTKVLLDTASIDIGGGADTATNSFIAPVDGYYSVYGQVLFQNVISDGQYTVGIYKNDTTQDALNSIHSSPTNTISSNISTTIYLDAAESLQLYARCTVGANTVDLLAGANAIYMTVHLIHATS